MDKSSSKNNKPDQIRLLILTRHNIDSINGMKKILQYFFHYFSADSFYKLFVATQGEGPFTQLFRDLNVTHIPIKMNRKIEIFRDLLNVLKLIFIIKSKGIQLIHAHAA